MDEGRRDVKIEAAVVRALEAQPEVVVPVAFAARVGAALPERRPTTRRVSAGRHAGIAAVVVLVAAVFCIAPHTAPSFTSLAFDVEMLLLLELAGIVAWLTNLRREL
jgi:hypothetical protein